MSKYFFGSDEDREYVVPFEHISKERASYHRLENSNMDYKIEVLDSNKALNNLHSLLCNMILDCRASEEKTLTLDEEDLSLLFEISGKTKTLKFWEN